jgi:hypothetical protein
MGAYGMDAAVSTLGTIEPAQEVTPSVQRGGCQQPTTNKQQPEMSATPPRARRSATFDSLPDKMKIHLMTEQAESARNNWDRLADAEQLQKVIDFYKEEEKGELPPGAHRALPEPWCSPYVPGPGASTGKAQDPHDMCSPGGALAQRAAFRHGSLFSFQ